ncbi:MAG: D-alanyl-D-alanine carboxypeptidase family protein [Armatimonadetes bacterium]|nr:D-alanyl-D-alanine carboxypeptidase family protein [Armatimonadota bacterium]
MAYTHGAPEPISALNRVRLIESGEPLVDLRVEMKDLPILRETAVPWVRKSVAHMLSNARLVLRDYDIGLREAWRSVERQRFIYDRYFNRLREEHPEWTYATLRRMTNRFFAPYDQKAPPGHSTGGAIDVWLVDSSGQPVDLSGKGERFRAAPTFSALIPNETRKLRMLLHDAMTAAGFTNCRDEWWHYSYGDAGWAVRAHGRMCIYGATEPPLDEYVSQDRQFVEAFLADPPF